LDFPTAGAHVMEFASTVVKIVLKAHQDRQLLITLRTNAEMSSLIRYGPAPEIKLSPETHSGILASLPGKLSLSNAGYWNNEDEECDKQKHDHGLASQTIRVIHVPWAKLWLIWTNIHISRLK